MRYVRYAPRSAWLVLGLLALLFAMPVATAADPVAAPSLPAPANALRWNELPADQQRLLQRYSNDWDSLPQTRQRALSRGAQRWLDMDPAGRANARDRLQAWRSLPEERRELVRRRWERFQQLDPESQASVRGNFRAFERLPPSKKQALRQRWLDAPPGERARMLERARELRARRP